MTLLASLGRLDGFCTACKREVVVSEQTLACPNCGRQVDPLSLPTVPKPAVVVREAPADPAPTTQQPIRLPSIRQAGSWGKATDDLLAALEREEAAAMAALEAAKERAKAARRAANAMRQVRNLVLIDGDGASRSVAPAASGRWSRKYDACINCGTTTIKHAVKGRCMTCESYYRRNGTDRPVEAVS